MIRMHSSRYVMIPDQCLPAILPTTRNLGSSTSRAGTSTKSGSSHNACASTKSMPCFSLFEALFSGSKSKSKVCPVYLNGMLRQPFRPPEANSIRPEALCATDERARTTWYPLRPGARPQRSANAADLQDQTAATRPVSLGIPVLKTSAIGNSIRYCVPWTQ